MDEKQRQQARDDMEAARDPLTQKRWEQEDAHILALVRKEWAGLMLVTQESADARTRLLIEKTLASMGGDLLSTYGKRGALINDVIGQRPPGAGRIQEEGDIEAVALSTLGGYLLERFGGDGDADSAGE